MTLREFRAKTLKERAQWLRTATRMDKIKLLRRFRNNPQAHALAEALADLEMKNGQ